MPMFVTLQVFLYFVSTIRCLYASLHIPRKIQGTAKLIAYYKLRTVKVNKGLFCNFPTKYCLEKQDVLSR